MSAFPCSGCGACCLAVSPLLPAKADGSCLNLGADRKTCTIYADRPDVCRVDKMRPAGISENGWHALNLASCVALRQHYGIPELA